MDNENPNIQDDHSSDDEDSLLRMMQFDFRNRGGYTDSTSDTGGTTDSEEIIDLTENTDDECFLINIHKFRAQPRVHHCLQIILPIPAVLLAQILYMAQHQVSSVVTYATNQCVSFGGLRLRDQSAPYANHFRLPDRGSGGLVIRGRSAPYPTNTRLPDPGFAALGLGGNSLNASPIRVPEAPSPYKFTQVLEAWAYAALQHGTHIRLGFRNLVMDAYAAVQHRMQIRSGSLNLVLEAWAYYEALQDRTQISLGSRNLKETLLEFDCFITTTFLTHLSSIITASPYKYTQVFEDSTYAPLQHWTQISLGPRNLGNSTSNADQSRVPESASPYIMYTGFRGFNLSGPSTSTANQFRAQEPGFGNLSSQGNSTPDADQSRAPQHGFGSLSSQGNSTLDADQSRAPQHEKKPVLHLVATLF
ncbi:hypothetical protein HUJ04_012446 [Dendroctonus ponderosae]|nr:hypothetical protein HUJ04_012446 [Dendroctonus ponderosae]